MIFLTNKTGIGSLKLKVAEQARIIGQQRLEIDGQKLRNKFLRKKLEEAEEGRREGEHNDFLRKKLEEAEERRREVELDNANLKERLADELKKRVGIHMTK